MHPPLLEPQDIRLLTEIGMLGAGAGAPLAAPVEQLFSALMVLRPDRDFPYIGQAVACFNQGRPDQAVAVLERGLSLAQAQADRDLLSAFLGLGLLMARRTAEGQRRLQQLLQGDCEPGARRMACALLGLPVQEAQTEDVA